MQNLNQKMLADQYQPKNFLNLAKDGLESSWNLQEWTDFSKYIKYLKKANAPDDFDKSFYLAIFEIK